MVTQRVACSYANATWSTERSALCLPMICIPIGKPSALNPLGTLITGNPFNDCKSPIKALDYAALGLATLASDVPAYRGSLADDPGGVLVVRLLAPLFNIASIRVNA